MVYSIHIIELYGGRGAMAAHLDVAQAVDGSNPFDHPKIFQYFFQGGKCINFSLFLLL